MAQNRLSTALRAGTKFVVTAELTSGPNFNFAPIKKFLSGYKKTGPSVIPAEFDFAAFTSTDNSGGTPNMDTLDIIHRARQQDLVGDLDFVPHISCKDRNKDALASILSAFRGSDIESMLVITGDKPLAGRRVFGLETVTFLQMIQRWNWQNYQNAKPENLETTHQFFPAAAVSPFKYTEASQMQQYYKMEKKIAAGAEFLVTQVGWDWKKSLELFRYLKENNIDIPVIGNVFLLSTTNPAPKLMNSLKLPGCFVSDEFLAKLHSETLDEHIERAAQQAAMYKSMGAAGVDIGSVHDYDIFVRVLQRASEIGDDWEQYKDNLSWPKENGFYLYDDRGIRVRLSRPKKPFAYKNFCFVHNLILDANYPGFHILKRIMKLLGAEKGHGCVYRLFEAVERAFKYLLFDCENCGDCYLYENFGMCTFGGCEKGLDNIPCGDSTVDGMCGNNLDRVCVGELIYNRASSEGMAGIEKLRNIIIPPRIQSLDNTASILNYLFSVDHSAISPLAVIGESILSFVPAVGAIMKELHDLGDSSGKGFCPQLEYIKSLIKSQDDAGAAYIAVNCDAFTKESQQLAIDIMSQIAGLVGNHSKSAAICIDSSDVEIITAALKNYSGNRPLVGTVRPKTLDDVLKLKRDFDFNILAGLKQGNIKEQVSAAREIFKKAIAAGLTAEQIYFEIATVPLSEDSPYGTGEAGKTYIAFETIKRIKASCTMKGVHCVIRPSLSGSGLPRSVGVCRAYIDKAIEYGLDTAFVDAGKQFGILPSDPGLLELADAYATMDGSAAKKQKVVSLSEKPGPAKKPK